MGAKPVWGNCRFKLLVKMSSRIESITTSPNMLVVPHLIIEPSRGLFRINWRELWQYRELFAFLVWREIKVRYKQTLLGASWAVIQPTFNMIVFTLFFGRLAGIPSDNVPYPIFSYTALLLWTYFAQSLNMAGNSLTANINLVNKIYCPRLILPSAPVLAGLMDLAIACSLLLVLFPYYQFVPSANIWAAPIMIVLAVTSALGVGVWLAALNVKYRDFRYVIPFLTQFWMFSSPVVYPASMVPEQWRVIYGLNPMTGAIEGFRWALLGIDINPWPMVGASWCTALFVLGTGLIYFRRTERFFADLI